MRAQRLESFQATPKSPKIKMMEPPHHQLDNPNNVGLSTESEYSTNPSLIREHSNQGRSNSTVTTPEASQRSRRRPRRGGRSAYNDERRVEVAAVRAVGACPSCRRRKVRCTHVIDGSLRNHSQQSKPPNKSTRGFLQDLIPNTSSQNEFVSNQPARRETLERYVNDLKEDAVIQRFVPSPKSRSPEAEAQERIGSHLGRLSHSIPTQWQSDILSANTDQNSMQYPTEIPDDREMDLIPEPVGYSQPHQAFQGPTQNYQTIPPGDNSQSTPVFICRRPFNPTNIDGLSTNNNNGPIPYAQTEHSFIAPATNQMHSSFRPELQSTTRSFPHVATPTNIPSNYSYVQTESLSHAYGSIYDNSPFDIHRNVIPISQPFYDPEDALSNLGGVPSLDYDSSNYETVMSQDHISNHGDAGIYSAVFSQTFSLAQPDISPTSKAPDNHVSPEPMDFDGLESYVDLLNSPWSPQTSLT